MPKSRIKSTVTIKSNMRKVYTTYVLQQTWTFLEADLTIFIVDQFPRGFPRLAAFQSSDDDFMIFRGFKRLHNRILLRLEVEITLLEEALDKLDSEDDGNDKMRYRLGHTKHKEGWSTTQLELLDQIRDKLSEYGKKLP